MDLSSVRALVSSVNFDVHGVAATVTLPGPDATPIETSVIWIAPLQDGQPVGATLTRRDAMRVLALRRDDVPQAPRGTLIQAPEAFGGDTVTWKVDGSDRVEADQIRVFVLPVPELV